MALTSPLLCLFFAAGEVMPIAPELKQFYGAEWREEVRPRILARAAGACECCGRPNHRVVPVRQNGEWWDAAWKRWRGPSTGLLPDLRPPMDRGVLLESEPGSFERVVPVQLGVAHLNHTSGDDRPENLAALCRWCHLWHDRPQHKNTRCVRKDSARPLLAGVNDNAAIA